MTQRVLVIDDDESLREVVAFHLREAGFDVDIAASGAEGVERYDPETHSVVVSDIRMPNMNGFELLDALKARDKDVVLVFMTAYGTVDRAIEAMRRGAFHYVEKPMNFPSFIALVETAASHHSLRVENTTLRSSEPRLIAASPAMNAVMKLVDRIAGTDATVLITGESGTGKELVARDIHRRSDRADQPFVAVNCAAIPADLLESVLFGHEKGAFTGATSAAPGKFRLADGGTLFLDEIAEMSPDLQAKLLRVLQDGEIETVGATASARVDVRVLAATHQDLEAKVANGSFREDLFYRLNVIPLEIPPLRQRREEIPVLVRHFLRKHAPGRDLAVSPELDHELVGRDWPGNVRELENVVKRIALLSEDAVLRPEKKVASSSPGGLPFSLPFALPGDELDLFELERNIILAALDKHDGNQSATARYLNIPRHVLLYRLDKIREDDEG